MHQLNLNYNIIAYFVMKLRFVCHSWSFVTIMKCNYLKTSFVQSLKASFGYPQTGFVFMNPFITTERYIP